MGGGGSGRRGGPLVRAGVLADEEGWEDGGSRWRGEPGPREGGGRRRDPSPEPRTRASSPYGVERCERCGARPRGALVCGVQGGSSSHAELVGS